MNNDYEKPIADVYEVFSAAFFVQISQEGTRNHGGLICLSMLAGMTFV